MLKVIFPHIHQPPAIIKRFMRKHYATIEVIEYDCNNS